MVIGTVTALLLIFGGGKGGWTLNVAIDVMAKHAKKIDDDAKEARARAITAEMKTVYADFEKEITRLRKQMVKVDSRYQATAADYRGVFRALDEVWDKTERKLFRLRFRLKDEMTREQWTTMFAAIEKKLK